MAMRAWRPGLRTPGLTALVSTVVLLATAVTTMAQEEPAPGEAAQAEVAQAPPDLATLETMCGANAADEDAERLCLYVVREIILRAQGGEPETTDAQPSAEPEPVVYGLGEAQERAGMTIKPVKVDWNVPPVTSLDRPRKGTKYVGVLLQVRHEPGEKEMSFDEWDWAVRDRNGFSYDELIVGQARPALSYSDIEPGQTVRGWLTFQVPRKTRWLEVRHERPGSYDPMYWAVEDRKRG
jgi:hypothetical protein